MRFGAWFETFGRAQVYREYSRQSRRRLLAKFAPYLMEDAYFLTKEGGLDNSGGIAPTVESRGELGR
jgi:hypothetical protein